MISQWDISHKGSYSITFTSDIGFNFFDLTVIPWDLTIKNGDFRVTSPTKIVLSWGYDGIYNQRQKRYPLVIIAMAGKSRNWRCSSSKIIDDSTNKESIVSGSYNGGTVPYKAIFCGDIP